jgi:hypothetical protein
MTYPVSFMGMASSSSWGFVGSSIGSLVQGASTPKNKQVYEWEKGQVQFSNSDTLTLNLLTSFTKEIYDIELREPRNSSFQTTNLNINKK